MPAPVQEFLIADAECFYVYCALAYERASPTDTMQMLELSPKAFWKHVRQLDRFGMLTVTADDQIHIARIGQHVWVGRGPLLDEFRRRWAREAAEDAVANYGEPGWAINTRTYRLSADSRAELEREVRRLHAEYQTRSIREELALNNDELTLIRFVSVLAPGGFLKAKGSNARGRPAPFKPKPEY